MKIEDDMWEKEQLVDLFNQLHVPPVIIRPYEDRDEDTSDSEEELDSDSEE